jgi:hypothetical protein
MFKEVLTAKGDQEEKSERGRIRKRCHYYVCAVRTALLLAVEVKGKKEGPSRNGRKEEAVAAAAAEEEGYVVYSPSKGRRNK